MINVTAALLCAFFGSTCIVFAVAMTTAGIDNDANVYGVLAFGSCLLCLFFADRLFSGARPRVVQTDDHLHIRTRYFHHHEDEHIHGGSDRHV